MIFHCHRTRGGKCPFMRLRFLQSNTFFVGQTEINLPRILEKTCSGKENTQHKKKKTKVIIPDIGSHISLKPVFFVSFAPIVMFVRV